MVRTAGKTAFFTLNPTFLFIGINRKKMATVSITFFINDDTTLRNCIITDNDTGLDSDMELLKGIARAILIEGNMNDLGDEVNKILQ